MAHMTDTIDEALSSEAFASDPYPTYRRLLQLESPYRSEARGGWLISRFGDVTGTFRDWEHFSSEGRVATMLDHFTEKEWDQLSELQRWSSLKGIIHSDPPDHPPLRALLVKAFTRKVVQQLTPDVQRLVDELLDRVQDRGEMDVVRDVASQLPAAVISEMLGVPSGDRTRFMAWSDTALGLQGNQRPSLDVALAAQDAYVSLQDYFDELIEDRRRNPRHHSDREDLLTSLIDAGDHDGQIARPDLIQSCITLLMGGFETTTSLISNTMVLLLQHPDHLKRLQADPTLMGPTIEESLRYETPIQTVTRRVAKDIRMGDEVLGEGDLAVVMIGAANRDPRQFEHPDRFDTARDNRHIAFGFGIHFCIGAPLARLEAPIALQSILERMPAITLADEEISWNVDKTVVRCPATLPVTF